MKINSFVAIAATAVAAISSSVAADITIRLTGSTAFRSATFTVITDVLNDNGDFRAAYNKDSASASGSDRATFQGTVTGVGKVTIQCGWQGSAEGVDAAVTGFSTTFIPVSSLPVSGTSYSVSATETQTATVGLSDIFPSSASDANHVLRGYEDTDCETRVVGVVPFNFLINETGKTVITNITTQQARLLYGSGTLATTGFGVTASPQNGYTIYAIGRNAASGTRTTVFAETGIGISAAVTQYRVTSSDSFLTASGFTYLGDSGESSGGTVATALGADSAGQSAIIIGYAGDGDATTAIGKGAARLTYNGVANTRANITSGNYTLWGYEHFCLPAGTEGSGSDLDKVADLLVTAFDNADNIGSAGIPLGEMAAERTGDGALVAF